MTASNRGHTLSARRLCLLAVAPLGLLVALPAILSAQSVPRSLESPPAQPPQTGPHGEKLPGMPKFHDPAPYDFDEHTGYKQIFDTKSLAGEPSNENRKRRRWGNSVPQPHRCTLDATPTRRPAAVRPEVYDDRTSSRLLVPSHRPDCGL
jgi:hypothetical protein